MKAFLSICVGLAVFVGLDMLTLPTVPTKAIVGIGVAAGIMSMTERKGKGVTE